MLTGVRQVQRGALGGVSGGRGGAGGLDGVGRGGRRWDRVEEGWVVDGWMEGGWVVWGGWLGELLLLVGRGGWGMGDGVRS